MQQFFFKQIRSRISSNINHLLVAFSGGLDSCVLLHLCAQFRLQNPALKISALHIHHGLSANADHWALHCQNLCQQWQIEFQTQQVVVELGARISLEASAREQRYKVLHQALTPNSLLLTAHHKDDQIETFFLALKRGSGLDGLTAMPVFQQLAIGAHFRPLLGVTRAELEKYALEQQLSWVEDESNQDTSYDRNFIRHVLTPLLQERWQGFTQTTARSIAILAAQREILEDVAVQDLAQCLFGEALNIESLSRLSAGRRDNVLRFWLRQNQAPLWSQAQLIEAWQAVALAKEDAQPKLEWEGWQLRRFAQKLFLHKTSSLYKHENLCWDLAQPLALGSKVLSANFSPTQSPQLRMPLKTEQITVRFACAGSLKVQPHWRDNSRELKKVWQELAIPPWRREQIPMIFYNEQLVAAVGYWLEKGFLVKQDGWQPQIA